LLPCSGTTKNFEAYWRPAVMAKESKVSRTRDLDREERLAQGLQKAGLLSPLLAVSTAQVESSGPAPETMSAPSSSKSESDRHPAWFRELFPGASDEELDVLAAEF
jgi:hypothetical protein